MSGAYVDLKALYRLKYKARGFSFLPRQPVRSLLAGRHGSKLRGRGLNFEEIRQYRPGDDIRMIDWKVTARTQKTHTRVYTEERDRPAVLVVDQRQGMFFGSARAMKSVVAAELAALVAWRVLASGDRVGGFVFGDTDMQEVRPRRSEKTVIQLLHQIIKFGGQLSADSVAPDNESRLNDVLRKVARSVTHDTLIVLISDLRGANDVTRQILTDMSRRNSVIIGFVADALEQDLPDAGRLVASDQGLQLEFDSGDASLRQQYASNFRDRLDRGKQMLLRRRIPLLKIMTDTPPEEQLVRLLGEL